MYPLEVLAESLESNGVEADTGENEVEKEKVETDAQENEVEVENT